MTTATLASRRVRGDAGGLAVDVPPPVASTAQPSERRKNPYRRLPFDVVAAVLLAQHNQHNNQS